MHIMCSLYLLDIDLLFTDLSRMSESDVKLGKNKSVSILQRRLHTRSHALIWSLPTEVLLHLLRGLQITDLLNLRSVKSQFVLCCHY